MEMTRDPAIVGRVYGIIAEGIEKWFSRTPRLAKYELFRKYLTDAGNKAYRDTGGQFPIGFYEQLADVILDWAWNRFDGVEKGNLSKMLKQVWKLHRFYVTMDDLSMDAMDDGLEKFGMLAKRQQDELGGECNRYVAAISTAALRHVEALAKYINRQKEADAAGTPNKEEPAQSKEEGQAT